MFPTNFRVATLFLLVIILNFSFSSGLECFKCNSKSIADCAVDPSDKLPTERCPATDTECAMAVFDDMVTYRGCVSSIEMPEECDSCVNATCTGDLCNGGIYPEDRLKCHRCQRGECVTVSGKPKPCQNYDSSDFCYIDVIDETDVIRGCVSDDDYDAGVYTVFCRTEGCNNEPALSEFSCVSCDSEKDENCKHGDTSNLICQVNATNFCTVDVLFGRRESCYTYHDGLRVIRGCARLDPDVVTKTEYITQCRQNNCNTACVTSPMCHVCDSRDDESCYDDQTSLTPQNCPLETSSCFTCKNEDDSVTRGCYNSSAIQGVCESCSDTRGCNSKEVLACYQCDSKTNENCATWKQDETLNFQVCPSSCLSKVTADGQTIRGCKADSFTCDPDDLFCEECDSLICNGGTFPKDRVRCFQCNENDSYCDRLSLYRYYACPVYDSNDQCYQFLSESGNMVRGCKSDSRYMECKEKGGLCIECAGPECNNLPVRKTNGQFCMVCEDDKDCGWAQLTAKFCTALIPFYQEPSCFTHVRDDNVVARGCLGDANDCEPSEDSNCEICKSAACNRANIVYQSCVQCSTENNEDPCADNAQGINGTRCPNDIQFYDKRGCYVMKKEDHFSRGCVSELDEETYNMCMKDGGSCNVCLTQNCNYQKLTNSAGALSHAAIYFVAIISLAIKYF